MSFIRYNYGTDKKSLSTQNESITRNISTRPTEFMVIHLHYNNIQTKYVKLNNSYRTPKFPLQLLNYYIQPYI
jgi:hypothetical protein